MSNMVGNMSWAKAKSLKCVNEVENGLQILRKLCYLRQLLNMFCMGHGLHSVLKLSETAVAKISVRVLMEWLKET